MTHVRRLPPIDHHPDQYAANAAALEANAHVFDRPLDSLNDVEALLELQDNREPLHKIRACMALLRSLRNDTLDLAARHHAAGVDNGDG